MRGSRCTGELVTNIVPLRGGLPMDLCCRNLWRWPMLAVSRPPDVEVPHAASRESQDRHHLARRRAHEPSVGTSHGPTGMWLFVVRRHKLRSDARQECSRGAFDRRAFRGRRISTVVGLKLGPLSSATLYLQPPCTLHPPPSHCTACNDYTGSDFSLLAKRRVECLLHRWHSVNNG